MRFAQSLVEPGSGVILPLIGSGTVSGPQRTREMDRSDAPGDSQGDVEEQESAERAGFKKDERCIDRLSRVWYWKGPAWYQRRVTIPDAWKGKRITLILERTKNTRVWVDKAFRGWEDTLSAPQYFDADLLKNLLATG